MCRKKCFSGFQLSPVNFLLQPIDDVSRALVLSLGVCYHARLQEREPYRLAVAPIFSHPCQLPGGHERILQEITR